MTRSAPLAAVARGLAAGAIGTLTMDAVVYRRYRRDGGTAGWASWESTAGLETWEDAPAPAQVGRRLVEAVRRRALPPSRARLTNNIVHWAYGMAGGAQYGLAAGALPTPRVPFGVPFGAAIWSAGYVVLPLAGLYEPIWRYDRRTLAADLTAHLVYGVSTAAAFELLTT